jgi:hypothetical protein
MKAADKMKDTGYVFKEILVAATVYAVYHKAVYDQS